jgi:sulfite reductase beta subunit-like hemoprotein
MYRYDDYDRTLVAERVAQFRDQTRRFLAGELTEDEFRPLRLRNGLYIQRHAPMLRIAIPYGLVSSAQLRKLAHVARKYDRGYGHFSTRQNLQLNWPRLEDVPEILAELAEVEMHAIQTSGNCVRNITTDHFAGVAPDEILDARPLAEILRQWSTFHPEFNWLPRKFKIAINGAIGDRVALLLHDIGLQAGEERRGRGRPARGRGRRHGPHADDRPRDSRVPALAPHAHVRRGDPAPLQPLRAPRQPVEGAHQDPREDAGRRGVRAPGRGGMGRDARLSLGDHG